MHPYTHIHSHIYSHIHTYVCTCIDAFIHAHIQTCIHTYISGHFTSKVHSSTPPELEELVLRVQRHAYFTKHLQDKDTKKKGQKDFFNVDERIEIINGILCPVWNMPECKFNQLGGSHTLRRFTNHFSLSASSIQASEIHTCIHTYIHTQIFTHMYESMFVQTNRRRK